MKRIGSKRWTAGIASSLVVFGFLWAVSVRPALASQIFIQQSGSVPAGGDPNLITNTGSFVVGVAGNHTLQNPLLIIVGVYNGVGTPCISFGAISCEGAAAVGTYGLTAITAPFTALSSGSAYAQLGLSAGGSESFGNWSAGDVANGFAAPTSFNLYAFALNTSLTGPGSPITIDESGAAAGSYIIGYSCDAGTGSSSGCATNGDRGQTVFTNTGLVGTSVPEPETVLLLALGITGVGLWGWKRQRNVQG